MYCRIAIYHNMKLDELKACTHEEADQRLFLHAKHASESCNLHLVKTINTDLVVIAVLAFQQLPRLNDFWIEFRTGKTMEFIPVHKISILSDDLYAMNNYSLMLLPVAIPPFYLLEKVKSPFLKNGKILQR